MQMLKFREREIDPVFNLFKENCLQYKSHVDEKTLTKSDQKEKHFSVVKTIFENDGLQQQILGYLCIYQYDKYQIRLEHLILNGLWKIISQELNSEEEEKCKIILEDINNTKTLSFDQQSQLIIKEFDRYFHELNEKENSVLKEDDDDDEIKDFNQLSLDNHISPPSTIIELDEGQMDSPRPSEFIDSHQISDCLKPPTTSNRIRQDSSCSSTNSLKYTQFVPPSTVSIRRRRVIQSMVLHVQRKKKSFDKLVNQLKHIPPEPTMYQLGLEFLRLHDGKFNYPPGHTFKISLEKRTWFLTINNIKCVECQLGECEPRSVLILQYKNKLTTVQV